MNIKEGAEVVSLTGIKGTVVEIADDVAYIETPQGAEMEFPIGKLVLASAVEADVKLAPEPENGVSDEHMKKCTDVLARLPKLLMTMAEVTHHRLNEALRHPRSWTKATAFQRLNVVAAVMGKTGEQLITLSEQGKLMQACMAHLALVGEKFKAKA